MMRICSAYLFTLCLLLPTGASAQEAAATSETVSSAFKHNSALELGSAIVGTTNVPDGHDVTFKNTKTFTLGFLTKTSFLMGLVKVPFLEASVRLHYEPLDGQTDYNYVGNSGVQYSKTAAPFKLKSYKADVGYRINPLFTKRFQPFIEFGANLGHHTIRFSDAVAADLAQQGTDYRLEQKFGSYGYYGRWGGVFYLSEHLGFYFDHGVTYQTGFVARLFGKPLISRIQNLSFGLNYGF